ncbi:MAG: sugar ABC transporter ATP-binding protein [Bauldia sp.]|uniref:sugar ABC transporter ATP-binding protein n=1 Tax=Bauldia sp. TaxID=2575872 RepID=UPI001D483DD8|nr:sugar ABC transporter ATP-binding protein [Bauldia sp.]MCB1495857.1 sugar ABC transporter ATP-binding protein [Bauldia sp.]
MNLLTLSNVSKAYAGVPALTGVALTIAPGEIHALMGENGAGKSTLIKILAGVVAPDEAEIAIDGRAVTIDDPEAAFAHGLRFIHQELNTVPTLSVAENIFLGRSYPRRIGGLIDWRRLAAMAREALGRLGISHIDPRAGMGRLGTGDRMLVNISAAFLDTANADARLYVMDEPTAALTGAEAERLFSVLRAIRESGRSVIYVSHRLDEVMHLCDRVTVLRDGEAIATRPIAGTSQNDIIRMMIGRQVDQAYPHALAAPRDDAALAVRDLEGGAVGPLSFELRKGEIVGIAGLAGAGQSDVLKLLMRAEKVHRGTILIDGKAELPGGLAGAWRSRLAYVPRERRSEGLVLTRPIAENITLAHLGRFSRGGAFLARGREKAIATARGEEVRLKARGLRQLCYELSGGNQQKVVFARALSVEPKVLLLDEPTRGVDVGAKFDIYSLIRVWSARGMAVLVASSDFPELIGMCDRIMVMRAGKIATVLEAAGLSEEELLGHCYGAGAPRDAPGTSGREARQ